MRSGGTRPMGRSLIALLTLLAMLAGAAPSAAQGTEPDAESAPEVRTETDLDPNPEAGRPRVWAIHDSVMLGARTNTRAALPGYEVNFDGFGGFRPQAAPALIARQRHLIDDIVVVALGTNYLGNEANFAADVERTLVALADVDRVIWVNAQVYRRGMLEVNRVLEAAATRWDNVQLADWAGIWRPEYVWAPGDVHLTHPGRDAYAELVRSHVEGDASVGLAPKGAALIEDKRGSLLVTGYAYDPDDEAPVMTRVLINGQVYAEQLARRPRSDLGHLEIGPRHGFRMRLSVPDGVHRVCVEALDLDGKRSRVIGCEQVALHHEPVGSLDRAVPGAGTITLGGWVMDPDRKRPSVAHVYIDGRYVTAVRARVERPDVAAAFGNGSRHGFLFTVPSPPGVHEVCIYGINEMAGWRNPSIGCRTVTV